MSSLQFRRAIQLLALLALAAGVQAQTPGDDWPQFLGPERNLTYRGRWSGTSTFTSLWTKAVGEGFSSPVVAQGRLLVFHRQNNREILDSLEPATGKAQWSAGYATGYRDNFGFSEGPRATPTVDGDLVFTYGAEGTLQCVNLKTGARVWQLDARQAFGVRKEFFGTGSSPLIDGDRLLMNIGGAAGAGIIALDKLTGKTLWKALTHESGYSSAIAATIGGARHALFFTREGLVDADPSTGRIRFEQPWRARMAASINAAVPVVVGDEVFITASYGTGAALWKIQGDKATQVWSGDESLSSHYATPVHKDGYLYGFHGRQEQGQELRCVEWKTGQVKWSVPDLGAGTVTLAGTHLFVLKENGELVIAPADPKAFRPGKKIKVAGSTLRAYPALAGGRLYVRTDAALSAWRID